MRSELPVGDPARALAGRAVTGSLGLAVLFVVFSWSAKKLPALYAHEPWQDDPYDAVVSFAVLFVPVLAALCVLRVPLCRRDTPLPARRVRDLLRASQVLILVVIVTLASDWISVVLRVHRRDWSSATALAVAGLAVVSVASLAVTREVRRASRQPLGAADGPDWLSDAVSLGERVAARLGPVRPVALRVVRWIDRYGASQVRRHPLLAAGALSLAFGLAIALSQGLQEGYPLRGYLLFLIVHAGSMFAFLTVAGAYLGLARAHSLQRAGGPEPARTRRRARVTHAVIAACASMPVTGAFRTTIWSLLGVTGRHAGTLIELMLAGAAGVAAVTFAAETLLDRRLRAG